MTTSNDFPYFLIIQLPEPIDNRMYRDQLATFISHYNGTLLANCSAPQVECLEKGTPSTAILIAQFPHRLSIQTLWQDANLQKLLESFKNHPNSLILAVSGLPYIGLPQQLEIPTLASVTPPLDRGPRAYMLIQGTGTDSVRMGQYRDIILPMLKEQGAYYTVFEIEGNIECLHGQWTHKILAISRWPDYEAGHAFWDSELYQKTAIPLRTGAGHFLVHFFQGLADYSATHN
ncbi:MAG: DUF1330 domain-containing protein [Microcystaceae cyanobacterium]